MGDEPQSAEDIEDPHGIDLWERIKASAAPLTASDHAELDAMMKRIRGPLAPRDPRRHHYIPQFFQKRFANEDERLTVIDLSKHISPPRHVVHIAQMKDLYRSIDKHDGDTVAIERMLAEIDGQASSAIARLAHGVLFPPQPKDRGILALWFALLSGRDPYSRRQLEAMADYAYKIDLALNRDPDVARTRERLSERLGRAATDDEVHDLVDAALHTDEFEVMPQQSTLIQQFLDAALAMSPHLMRRKYTVLKFQEPGLALCDRPVVYKSHAPGRSVGAINADEIWLPLDRSTGLILHDDSFVGDVVIRNSSITAAEFNQVIVWNAAVEVYCHPDDADDVCALKFPPSERPLLVATGSPFEDLSTDGVNAPPVRQKHRRPETRGGEVHAPNED